MANTKSPQYALKCREQLANLPLVDELAKLLTCLTTGFVPVYSQPARDTSVSDLLANPPATIEWRPMEQADVSRLSLLLKTNESMLRKLLPDLKAIEVTDASDRQPLSDTDLAQRINGILAAANPATPNPATKTSRLN